MAVARRAAVAARVAAVAIACAAGAPAAAQTIELTPDRSRVTVGDSVVFRVAVRLRFPEAALTGWVPEAEGVLPLGMQVASDSVTKTGTGTYQGRAVVRFLRPGRQTVPSFSLPYRRGAFVLNALVRSEPVPIVVTPVLTPGGQQLKDIKPLVPPPRLPLLPVAAALAALAGGAALVARRLRRRALPAPAPALARAAPTAEPRSAYAAAVERLAAIEREGLPARGEVARHYEEVADVLRQYLEEGERLPARERTTAALARALPRRLAEGGLRQRCRAVLGAADLVKFARVRPGEAQAAAFLAAARDLLDRWQHASHPAPAPPPGETPGGVLDEPRPADALR